MSEKELFYVDVEERAYITIAIEAEDAIEAADLVEDYVVGNVFPCEMTFADRSVIAYPVDNYDGMADGVVLMDKGQDPLADATAHLRRAIQDVIGHHGLSREDILGAAKAVVEELEAGIAAKPAVKIGV
jgi:hypothetical protein